MSWSTWDVSYIGYILNSRSIAEVETVAERGNGQYPSRKRGYSIHQGKNNNIVGLHTSTSPIQKLSGEKRGGIVLLCWLKLIKQHNTVRHYHMSLACQTLF